MATANSNCAQCRINCRIQLLQVYCYLGSSDSVEYHIVSAVSQVVLNKDFILAEKDFGIFERPSPDF